MQLWTILSYAERLRLPGSLEKVINIPSHCKVFVLSILFLFRGREARCATEHLVSGSNYANQFREKRQSISNQS